MLHEAKPKGVGKLRHKWRGPYEVIQATDFDNFSLREAQTDKVINVHVSKMQPFHLPNEVLMTSVLQLAKLFDENIDEKEVDVEDYFTKRRQVRNKSGRYVTQVKFQDKWMSIAEAMEVAKENPVVVVVASVKQDGEEVKCL